MCFHSNWAMLIAAKKVTTGPIILFDPSRLIKKKMPTAIKGSDVSINRAENFTFFAVELGA